MEKYVRQKVERMNEQAKIHLQKLEKLTDSPEEVQENESKKLHNMIKILEMGQEG